jgi:hypothetical protein
MVLTLSPDGSTPNVAGYTNSKIAESFLSEITNIRAVKLSRAGPFSLGIVFRLGVQGRHLFSIPDKQVSRRIHDADNLSNDRYLITLKFFAHITG